jgi:hypothetical protein
VLLPADPAEMTVSGATMTVVPVAAKPGWPAGRPATVVPGDSAPFHAGAGGQVTMTQRREGGQRSGRSEHEPQQSQHARLWRT